MGLVACTKIVKEWSVSSGSKGLTQDYLPARKRCTQGGLKVEYHEPSLEGLACLDGLKFCKSMGYELLKNELLTYCKQFVERFKRALKLNCGCWGIFERSINH